MKNTKREEVLWDKLFRQIRTEKDLRLLVSRFLKTHLKGLSPGFRIEVEVLSLRPPQVAIKIPAHSEGNLIRVGQVDQLVASLEAFGLGVEVLYEDDLLEQERL